MPGRSESKAFLGLGGNLGDPRRAMASALAHVAADGQTRVVAVSSLYRTPPWGKTDQPEFLNAVAKVATRHRPRELLEMCLSAEAGLHRRRAERWGPRNIDVDILLFDDVEMEEEGLVIPHPRMLERAFVMVPLAEIAPDLAVKGTTARDHAARLGQTGIVREAGADWWQV